MARLVVVVFGKMTDFQLGEECAKIPSNSQVEVRPQTKVNRVKSTLNSQGKRNIEFFNNAGRLIERL